MESYKIRPLQVGIVTGIDQSTMLSGIGFGTKLRLPCVAWLIEGAKGEKILVDSGPPEAGAPAERYHAHKIERADNERVDQALLAIGVDPSEIQIVILTHLHYDHCHNGRFFPKASFYVDSEELAFAKDPIEWQAGGFDANLPGIDPPWREVESRLRTFDADVELLPGLKFLRLPGHTPGSAGVAVKTARGTCVIAGDTVPLMANWEGNTNHRRIPPAMGNTNLIDLYHSFKKIENVADVVIPSHDYRTLEMRY